MIDTTSKERRESMSNEFPNVVFRYCFELKRMAQLAHRNVIDSIRSEQDIVREESPESGRIREFLISRATILEALDQDGVPFVSSVKYHLKGLKSWKEFPSKGILTLISSQNYRCDDDEIDLKEQGFGQQWIVDLLIKEDTRNELQDQLPALREATQRLEDLEELIYGIGSTIVSHFPGRNPRGSSRSSGRQQPSESNACGRNGRDIRNSIEEEGQSTFEGLSGDEGINERKLNDSPDQLEQPCELKNELIFPDPAKQSLKLREPSTNTGKRSGSKRDRLIRNQGHSLQMNRFQSQIDNLMPMNRLAQSDNFSNLFINHRVKSTGKGLTPHEEQAYAMQHLHQKSHSYFYQMGRIRKTSEQFQSSVQYPSTISKLDLVFIASDPLLQEIIVQDRSKPIVQNKIEIIAFNQPLDTDQEFERIVGSLRKTEKKFKIRKEVANHENLKSVMAYSPLMIHISCHGDCYYDVKEKKNVYFLAFEDAQKKCMLDKLDEGRLKELLRDGNNHDVQLVFVSACHSEMIGQLFKRIGVPVVIAVNSHTAILDEVCGVFSKHFYQHLLSGNSAQQAFNGAQSAVKASKIDCFACCCSHKHKYWCKWQKHFSKKENSHIIDEAHNAHMPNSSETNCKCGLKNNEHRIKSCKFYKEFKLRFEPSFDEIPPEDIVDPVFGQTTIKVCCCSPELPHDETYKFMIVKRQIEAQKQTPKAIGVNPEESKDDESNHEENLSPSAIELQRLDEQEELILNTPMFLDRGEGQVVVEGNMDKSNQLKSVIDSNMLIGRNMEIREIVQFLNNTDNSSRFLHLYGPSGHGKSEVANFAGKYALYGRVDLDGAVYVDAGNKDCVKLLIASICRRLSERTLIPQANNGEYTKENIISIIHERKYLIIIDKCSQLIAKAKKEFNKLIGDLINRTLKTKFIVITYEKDDIEGKHIHNNQQVLIPELNKVDAARLLMHAAKESQYLSGFKNEYDLSRHAIFTVYPLKPQGIVQIAMLLKTKQLDEIVQETIKQNQTVEESKDSVSVDVPISQSIQEQEAPKVTSLIEHKQLDFNIIMKLSFDQLLERFPLEKFPYEYELLYILCQMPAGLFDSDLEKLNTNFADWRFFFGIISADKNPQVDEEKPLSKSQPSQSDFKFLVQTFYSEYLECHYLPDVLAREFINSKLQSIQHQNKIKVYFDESLKYLALLIRRILRSHTIDNKNNVDLKCVSAALDEGIWHDDMGATNPKESVQMIFAGESTPSFNVGGKVPFKSSQDSVGQSKIENYFVKYHIYEPNFSSFLDLNLLQSHYPDLNYWKDAASADIQELCVSKASFLIESNQYEEAATVLGKCEKIAQNYQMMPLIAKLTLLRVSLSIKRKDFSEPEFLISSLKQVVTIFQQNKVQQIFIDGIADALYLQAVIQIENFYQQRHLQLTKSSSAPFSKQNSDVGNPESPLSTAAPEHQRSLSSSGGQQKSNTQEENGWSAFKLKDEIQSTRRKLQKARNYYQNQGIRFGVAKVNLIEAEFLIELIFSEFNHNLIVEDAVTDIRIYLTDAIQFFQEDQYKSLHARSLRTLGLLWLKQYFHQQHIKDEGQTTQGNITAREELISDLHEAKRNFEQALEINSDINDQNQLAVVNDYLNQTLEQIRMNSNNVLIFAKAFPLVHDTRVEASSRRNSIMGRHSVLANSQQNNQGEILSVGPISRQQSDFKRKMLSVAKKSKQSVNVKFDMLTRDILQYVKTYGCKILHLSSHVFDEDRLCIEGQFGNVQYINMDLLKTMLSSDSKLNVEIIVLAIPMSTKIAQTFIQLGVKHVIAFNLESFVKHAALIPKVYEFIYNFCATFYKILLSNNETVAQAFESSFYTHYDEFLIIIERHAHYEQMLGRQTNFEDSASQGPKLFPIDSPFHQVKLYDELPKQVKKEKRFLDTSRNRKPTNFQKFRPKNPFTGRRCMVYELIQELFKPNTRMVNIFGPEGIGKTRLVIETSHYLSDRDLFKDGIFYIDLKDVRTLQELKDRTKEVIIESRNLDENADVDQEFAQNHMLLVMDHIDGILNDKSKFDWDVITLINVYKHLKVVIVSRNEINKTDFESLKDRISTKEVPPLQDEEAVDLVISNCEREIAEEVVQKKLRCSVRDYILNDRNIQNCFGFPLYLHQLALDLSKSSLDAIDMKKTIQPIGQLKGMAACYKKWQQRSIDQSQKLQQELQVLPEVDDDIFSKIANQNTVEQQLSIQLSEEYHGPNSALRANSQQPLVRKPSNRGEEEEEKLPYYRQYNQPCTVQEEELQMRRAQELSMRESFGMMSPPLSRGNSNNYQLRSQQRQTTVEQPDVVMKESKSQVVSRKSIRNSETKRTN